MNGELEFEKPIVELERKLEELKRFSEEKKIDLSEEIAKLEKEIETTREKIFRNLNPWQRTLLARHPRRPYTLDYVGMIMRDFVALAGDRLFGEDEAIVGGLARFEGRTVVVIGHQKGRNTKENLRRNFGMPHPEGYRKAMRLMKLAEKFHFPVITFIDTPGAYPGIGAEERGQAEAIARNLMIMARLKTPIISIVIGEGGSGGALGIGVADRIYMLENAVYYVCTPEACSAILWRDSSKAPQAAQVQGITSLDLERLGVIDGIIPEPLGGAHRDPEKTAQNIKKVLKQAIEELISIPVEELLERRYEKYRKMGKFIETSSFEG
ncbi:acetyl-CoA carboxylase carboxyltransferase subunit alpha [Candidatus Calescamantes bacterium]|nr:acetyl-CoA carboxylase carboxyltransferase subunit alpha [Candidatus Calescamantes bacterium]